MQGSYFIVWTVDNLEFSEMILSVIIEELKLFSTFKNYNYN